MREFSVKGIRVELKTTGYAILMRPNYYSEMVDDQVVVYADPKKLKPFMQKILKENPVWYGANGLKRASARRGLLAAKTEVTEPYAILLPEGNPLPMPLAGARERPKIKFDMKPVHERKKNFFQRFLPQPSVQFGFTNGITRTFELLAQGAEFVPLETNRKEAAFFHQLVGGTKEPESVRNYTVPASVREETERSYYQQKRRGVHL
jgi:plasmid fertility inhibition factor